MNSLNLSDLQYVLSAGVRIIAETLCEAYLKFSSADEVSLSSRSFSIMILTNYNYEQLLNNKNRMEYRIHLLRDNHMQYASLYTVSRHVANQLKQIMYSFSL